ncbi:MAG: hypothetical protein V3W34_17580 [Phycisphaerae bacterium]
MKEPDRKTLNEWLLDEQLDQLDEADRQLLLQMLRENPELAAKHRRLQRFLEPLDAWTVPSPPPGLVDRILDEIAAADPHQPVVTTVRLSGAMDRGRLGGLGVSMRDILAVAAVIAFFFTLLGPSMSMVRERSRRVACAGNLGGIGHGVSAYSLANSGALPYSRAAHLTSFLPFDHDHGPALRSRPVYSPNSKSLFLLVRLRFVPDVRIFVCPSSKQPVSLNDVSVDDMEGFPAHGLCSYDSLNMAGPTPNYSLTAALPYMADANPLFVGGRFNPAVSIRANSPNHRNAAGQNVLCIDGAVDWCTTPNCGHRGDNIWQAGRIIVYKGTEVQETKHDSFLVP